MKAFLTLLTIGFAFILAGESLVCEHCINFNGTNCYGSVFACDDNSTSCENGIVKTIAGGNTTYMTFKTCARFPQCHNYFFSESIGEVHLQMQKNCCTTDNCNIEPIVLPPRNSTPNGVICPLCYAENTTTCEPQAAMNCTGLETKCVYFAGKVQQSGKIVTMAARNCITKEPCEENWFTWEDGPVLEFTHFSCSDNSDKHHD